MTNASEIFFSGAIAGVIAGWTACWVYGVFRDTSRVRRDRRSRLALPGRGRR